MRIKHQFIAIGLAAVALASCKKQEVKNSYGPETKDGMVKIEGGKTIMGSTGEFETPYGKKVFPEESPMRELEVSSFWIDETEVTNREFAKFVKATNYVTYAEQEADINEFPPEAHQYLPQPPFNQGAIVFTSPKEFHGKIEDPNSYMQWWKWDPNANWRHPLGEGSDIVGKEDHPVVCVNYDDAKAYAEWAGKRLPTEAEWEFAARGGLKGKVYVWGDELKPGDKWMANTFHGTFPTNDTAEDGFAGSAPVKSYEPNGYGLYDMAGNAWEICSDFYDPEYRSKCEMCDPDGPETWINRTSGRKNDGAPNYVTKGGSFLCHVSYCMRYRPGARHSLENDSPSCHTGFRCARDAK
ncbi:formylglycine-generating enzyme family protein [Luteolibacter algae]|uniref:Formylglycine-generating enzyme family protein n=1 Tax=Luteolibacter algae TaxID=454151 RepID=A0ABW5D764_9BACT